MSCCSKLASIVKKLVGALRKVLVIVLLVAAVYFTWFAAPGMLTPLSGLSWLPAGITTLSASGTVWGVAALGAALIVDSEAVADVVGGAANAVGTTAGRVVTGVAGGLVAGVTGSALGMSPLTLLAVAGLLYFFVFSDKAKKRRDDAKSAFASDPKPEPKPKLEAA